MQYHHIIHKWHLEHCHIMALWTLAALKNNDNNNNNEKTKELSYDYLSAPIHFTGNSLRWDFLSGQKHSLEAHMLCACGRLCEKASTFDND